MFSPVWSALNADFRPEIPAIRSDLGYTDVPPEMWAALPARIEPNPPAFLPVSP